MAVSGATVIRKRFKTIVRNVRAGAAVNVQHVAEDIVERSNLMAPQLSGEMIGTAKIKPRDRRDVISRTIFYDSPYAVRRHEDFYNLGPISSLKQSPDGPVGRKYLQTPFEKHRDRYIRQIGNGVRDDVRRSLR